MALDAFPQRATTPDQQTHLVRLLGTGASAPTVQVGNGVSVTRSAIGVYTLTWRYNPGVFVVALTGIRAATPGNVKNHSVNGALYVPSTRSLQITFWNAAGAARDLAADEYIDLAVVFRAS